MSDGQLGPWIPSTAEERLDRLDSLANIRQLAMRYGRAIDARDLDSLVDLFAPDVRVGRTEQGRDALRRWFDDELRRFRSSIHFVVNHVVDFEDADNATGVVYCRDELEYPDTDEWKVGAIQYWDRYIRVDGVWCFKRRKFHRWYIVDALERPGHGAGVAKETSGLNIVQLPDAYDTWGDFWAEKGNA